MKYFISPKWGTVYVHPTQYAHGGLAIELLAEDGERIAILSTRLDGAPPPPPFFWAKTWSENAELAAEALTSGLFRGTGERQPAGVAQAQLWEMLAPPNETPKEI